MWVLRWEIKFRVGSSSNNLRGNSLGYFLFIRAFSPHPQWPDRIIFPVIFRALRNRMSISEMEKKGDWPWGWHVSAYRSHLAGVEVSGGERGVTRTMALIYSKRSLSLLFSGPWPSVPWSCQSCFLLVERVKLRQSLLHKAPFAGWIEGRSIGDLQGDLMQSIPYNKGSQGKLD